MTDDPIIGWVVLMPSGRIMCDPSGAVVEFRIEDEAKQAAQAVGGIVAPLCDDEAFSAAGGEC
jgi:hypothetical protein